MNLVAEATRRRKQVWRIIDAHVRQHGCATKEGPNYVDRCPIVRALQQGSIALLEIAERTYPAADAKVSP